MFSRYPLFLLLILMALPISLTLGGGEAMGGNVHVAKNPNANALMKALTFVIKEDKSIANAKVSINDHEVIKYCKGKLGDVAFNDHCFVYFYFDGRVGSDLIVVINPNTGEVLKKLKGR